jgi:TonB family protein
MVALAWTTTVGCAAGGAARREDARHSDAQQATHAKDESSAEMIVLSARRTLNVAAVDRALDGHFGELRDCYKLDRRAQRPGGRVVVRFFVDGKGKVNAAAILESSIDNHAVERCIADVAVGVTFERPPGYKPTTIEYPIVFRAAPASSPPQAGALNR